MSTIGSLAGAGGLQITYNEEVTLTAPPGGILAAIMIKVEITPKHSGILIYGQKKDGGIGVVEVRGSEEKVELPFCEPKIYVKYLSDVKSAKISTLGYRDDLNV